MDSWLSAGAEGVWRQGHRTPRRTLVTPFRVAGGPEKGVALKKIRVTRGKYLGTQQEFEIIHDFSMPSNSHRMLKAGWTGVTEFREAEEYIENNVDGEIDENHEKLIAPPDLDEMIVEDQEPSGQIGSLILRERLVGDDLLRVRRDRCEPGFGREKQCQNDMS